MFIWQTDQGIKCLSVEKAGELAGSDPDYGIKDLYEAIATNNFVSTQSFNSTTDTIAWSIKINVL